MAFQFPLTFEQFLDKLPIRELDFDIPESVEISETGGGEILPADLGSQLWQGEVVLDDMPAAEAAEALAMISVARRPGASFMIYDVGLPGPRLDRSGALLGGATPVLEAVAGNRREMRIGGLTPGYPLHRYDHLAFAYGDDPVRYARHRIVSQGNASASGQIAALEVVPSIRPGVAIGTPITLIKPACKAMIVPGSVQSGRRRHTMTVGVSFKFIQLLR